MYIETFVCTTKIVLNHISLAQPDNVFGNQDIPARFPIPGFDLEGEQHKCATEEEDSNKTK